MGDDEGKDIKNFLLTIIGVSVIWTNIVTLIAIRKVTDIILYKWYIMYLYRNRINIDGPIADEVGLSHIDVGFQYDREYIICNDMIWVGDKFYINESDQEDLRYTFFYKKKVYKKMMVKSSKS